MADSAPRRRRAHADDALFERSSTDDLHDASADFPVLVFVQERLRQIVADKEELEEKFRQVLTENEELHQSLETESAKIQGLREILIGEKKSKHELDGRLAALDARLAESQKDARAAGEDTDRLRDLLQKESTARRTSASELADLRATAEANRGTIAGLRAELRAEQTARLALEEKARELGPIGESLSAARKRVDELEHDLAREIELRRSLEADVKSVKARAAQIEQALRRQLKDLEISKATLEEHFAGVQQEMEAKQDELEAKELEVARRLEDVHTRESDLMSQRAKLDREAIASKKAQAEFDKNWAQLEARHQELKQWREELDAQKLDPRVIRLDDIDQSDVDEKELLALLMAERHERGVAEAELERILERAALLERELARIKGQADMRRAQGGRRR
jgi:chromosome segregation ATPase